MELSDAQTESTVVKEAGLLGIATELIFFLHLLNFYCLLMYCNFTILEQQTWINEANLIQFI